MKVFVIGRALVKSIMKVGSYLVPYDIFVIAERVQRYIYSLYMGHSLFLCGDGVKFSGIERLIGGRHISVGNNSTFGKHLYLEVRTYNGQSGKISFGDDCHVGAYNNITSTNEIRVGRGLLTGKWVTITDNSHGDTDFESLVIPPLERNVVSKGPILIGDNVWIGDKATILPNVIVGDGAVIAANSVVTKDVPSYSVVAGCPAIVIKQMNNNPR